MRRLRLLGLGLLLGALAAVVTGPQGSNEHFAAGLTGALLHPRVIGFLLAGVVFAAFAEAWHRGGAAVRAAVSRPWDGARRLWGRDARVRAAGLVAVLAVLLVYPTRLSPFWQEVAVDQIGIYALLALGLNVVVGLAGLLDLGYIAFYAIGAYATAYFTGRLPVVPPFTLNPFLILPIAILLALVAGVLLGAPTLRLRGDYLAIVTLGFGEIIYIVAVNADGLTHGPQGAFGIPHFSAFGYHWSLANLPYYYLLLVFLAVIVVLFRRLEESRVGRAWTAIREDEVAAAASGVATVRYKLLAFSIGASTSGFAGVLFASKISFISPDDFLLQNSILVLVLVIFGGMGSITGVLLGAVVLQWLPEQLRSDVPATDRFIYFGALLIIMMIFRPQGLVPSRRRAREIYLAEAGVGHADALSAPPGSRL